MPAGSTSLVDRQVGARLDEAVAARRRRADYLLVGHCTAPHHPEREPLGLARLGPIVSLGLRDRDRRGDAAAVGELRRAGAYGVAAIRGLWDAPDPSAAGAQMLEEWQA